MVLKNFGSHRKLDDDKPTKSSLFGLAKFVVPLMLGTFCLHYILVSFEWKEILAQLNSLNVFLFLATAVITTICFWFLRALRWFYLLSDERSITPFLKLYLITAIALGFANFTPFQSGEAIKVEMLRKYGAKRTTGYAYFFFEKFLDMVIIAVSSVIGAVLLLTAELQQYFPYLVIGAGILFLFVLLLFSYVSTKKRTHLAVGESWILPDLKAISIVILISLFSWIVMAAGWKYMFQSGGVDLSFLQTICVISLTTIAAIISFVPGAIGVSEVTIAALLSKIGYSDAQAQTAAVLIGIYSLIILVLTILHLVVLKSLNYTKFRKEDENSGQITVVSAENL